MGRGGGRGVSAGWAPEGRHGRRVQGLILWGLVREDGFCGVVG